MREFGNWGKYFGDYYPDVEAELREVLKSGKPFNTQFHGWAKSMHDMKVCREFNNGSITVTVFSEIDSAYEGDLSRDCLTDAEEARLTDEDWENIMQECAWIDSDAEYMDTLEPTATFEEITYVVHELGKKTEETLTENWHMCIAKTLEAVYGDSAETHYLIKQRINDIG